MLIKIVDIQILLKLFILNNFIAFKKYISVYFNYRIMKKKKYIIFDDSKKNKKNIDDISNKNIFNNNFIGNILLHKLDNDKLYNDKVENNKIENNKLENDKVENDKVENDNNVYLKELIRKQIRNVSNDKKLNYNDIKRISKFLSSSIFDMNNCCIWNGYITNEKNQSKGTYINFYFNKKKIALHRLLYINYVDDVNSNEYIKFSCTNKGKCCNVNHMKKYNYNKNFCEDVQDNKINDKNCENKNNGDHISINTEKNKLIVEL